MLFDIYCGIISSDIKYVTSFSFNKYSTVNALASNLYQNHTQMETHRISKFEDEMKTVLYDLSIDFKEIQILCLQGNHLRLLALLSSCESLTMCTRRRRAAAPFHYLHRTPAARRVILLQENIIM